MIVENYMITLRTFKDIQSRRAMEATLRSQLDAVFSATEELVSRYLHHIAIGTSYIIPAKLL